MYNVHPIVRSQTWAKAWALATAHTGAGAVYVAAPVSRPRRGSHGEGRSPLRPGHTRPSPIWSRIVRSFSSVAHLGPRPAPRPTGLPRLQTRSLEHRSPASPPSALHREGSRTGRRAPRSRRLPLIRPEQEPLRKAEIQEGSPFQRLLCKRPAATPCSGVLGR